MKWLRDWCWILPSSLILGLTLSLLGPGTWWIGWLAYSILLGFGLLALSALWRSAGGTRMLLLMLLLAVILRLGLGMAFSCILPVYGYDTQVQKAGYAVRDAYSYDREAWKLASSGEPLWRAFDRSYKAEYKYNDQYGGLLFFHSLLYRYLSPDAQRPWLLVLFSALAGAIGVALAWKGTRQSWGEPVAWIVSWIMALFPDSLLAGSSAVRESFLILFTTMVFWGVVDWLAHHHPSAWAWLVGGIIGMLLYSPGVAVAVLVILGVWTWLAGKERHLNWWWFVGVLIVIALAVLLLGVILGGSLQNQAGPLANLFNWLHLASKYGAYLTELHSGWIEYVLGTLPESLHLPFIIGYGITQPVLPAAIVDAAVWPMHVLSILRGLGWYTLLPFLIYSLWPAWKTTVRRERLAWLWLWLTIWVWIVLAAARAGGDQWNNPRYRVILLLFQAILAARALTWQKETHDPWLGRILAVEGIFLLFFGEWYFSRYIGYIGSLPFAWMVAAIAGISAIILVGGWGWDYWKKKKRKAKQRQKHDLIT